MDLRSTQKGLTNSIKRFRATANVQVMGSFRGAIEPGFSDRISKHWQVLGTHFFRPVRLDFRTPAKPFGLLRLPNRRRSSVAHYTFHPRIQLKLGPRIQLKLGPTIHLEFSSRIQLKPGTSPGNNLFFETDANVIFQPALLETSVLREMREKLLTSSLAREFWASLREVNHRSEVRRQSRVPGTLMFSAHSRLVQTLERISQVVRQSERSQGSSSPFYIPILRAAESWKRFVTTSVSSSLAKRFHESRSFNWAGTFSLLRTVFNRGSAPSFVVNIAQTGDAANLRQSFVKHLAIPDVQRALGLSRSLFTTISLTLAAPKAAGIDSATAAAQHFRLSPNLSYARQDSTQLQAIANALRDLRTARSEPPARPTPQLPSIEQLTRQVRQQLEREIRIEKERRGL